MLSSCFLAVISEEHRYRLTFKQLAFESYRSVWKLKCTFLFPVLGQISAELDPETRSNGSGLKDGAERDQN